MTIVRFYNGRTFLVEEDKIVEIQNNSPKFEILVMKELNTEEMRKAISQGYKLFECKEDENSCISKIYNTLYSRKKSCKFA